MILVSTILFSFFFFSKRCFLKKTTGQVKCNVLTIYLKNIHHKKLAFTFKPWWIVYIRTPKLFILSTKKKVYGTNKIFLYFTKRLLYFCVLSPFRSLNTLYKCYKVRKHKFILIIIEIMTYCVEFAKYVET